MTTLTNPLARPATELIQNDHAMVLALYHKLHPRTAPKIRAALVRRLCTALEIHAALEEEIFYPALQAARIESPALSKSFAEHEQMRMLIGRVRSFEGQADAQHEALTDLLNAVLHHVADEETIVLPAAERMLAPQRLAELCAQMRARRLQLARGHAGEIAADVVRSTPARSTLAAAAMLVGAAWMVGRARQHGLRSLGY